MNTNSIVNFLLQYICCLIVNMFIHFKRLQNLKYTCFSKFEFVIKIMLFNNIKSCIFNFVQFIVRPRCVDVTLISIFGIRQQIGCINCFLYKTYSIHYNYGKHYNAINKYYMQLINESKGNTQYQTPFPLILGYINFFLSLK